MRAGMRKSPKLFRRATRRPVLPPSELRADRGAFFVSGGGTSASCDVWLRRSSGAARGAAFALPRRLGGALGALIASAEADDAAPVDVYDVLRDEAELSKSGERRPSAALPSGS